jgi:hypothetical protein
VKRATKMYITSDIFLLLKNRVIDKPQCACQRQTIFSAGFPDKVTSTIHSEYWTSCLGLMGSSCMFNEKALGLILLCSVERTLCWGWNNKLEENWNLRHAATSETSFLRVYGIDAAFIPSGRVVTQFGFESKWGQVITNILVDWMSFCCPFCQWRYIATRKIDRTHDTWILLDFVKELD